MANQTTKIIYDVSEAISKLKQLDRQTGKTGRKTKKDFEDGARGLKEMDAVLGRVNPKAGKALGAITRLSGAVGPMGVALGAAAAAGTALISVLGGMPDIMRDNLAAMEAFAKRTQEVLDQQNRISSIQDAQRNRSFRNLRDDVDTRRGAIDGLRAEANEAKITADARVAASKKAFAEIEKALKSSIQRQKSIRDQLNEGRLDAQVAQTGRGKTAGGRINELAFQAEKAAREGNLELARALTDEAQNLTAEQGNHVFFLKQIDAANQAITDNLIKQEGRETSLQAKLKGRAKEQSEALKIAQQEKKVLEDRIKLLEIESSKVGKLRKDAKVASRTEIDAQDAAEAGREVNAALDNISKFLKEGRSGFRNLTDAANFASDIASPFRSTASIQEDARTVGGDKRELVSGLREAFRDQKLTIGEIEGLNKLVESQEKALRDLKDSRPDQRLASSVEFEDARNQQIRDEIKKLGDAAIKGGEAGVDKAQSIRIEAKQIELKADQLKTNLDATKASTLQGPLPGQAAAPATNTTTNLSVKIEGGMLDEATMQQIETRFRRLIREEKSSGLA